VIDHTLNSLRGSNLGDHGSTQSPRNFRESMARNGCGHCCLSDQQWQGGAVGGATAGGATLATGVAVLGVPGSAAGGAGPATGCSKAPPRHLS
jgi:hypothetical protein